MGGQILLGCSDTGGARLDHLGMFLCYDAGDKAHLDAADVRVFLPMWGFTESFNISVATALVLQRLLDAMPDSRGALPPEEMQRLRTEWYDALARTEEQRAAFARLAERGGARPLRDTRRPEAHRDEQRGRTGEKRRLWSRGVGAE